MNNRLDTQVVADGLADGERLVCGVLSAAAFRRLRRPARDRLAAQPQPQPAAAAQAPTC